VKRFKVLTRGCIERELPAFLPLPAIDPGLRILGVKDDEERDVERRHRWRPFSSYSATR
jgi:hypothetical protein